MKAVIQALVRPNGEVVTIGGHDACEALKGAYAGLGEHLDVVGADETVKAAWEAEQERARMEVGRRGYKWAPVMVDVVDGVATIRGGE